MAKKPKATVIDFDFGIGSIIPSTQQAYKVMQHKLLLKPEKGQLAIFKETLAKDIDSQLEKNTQFPSNNETFIFIMQYFAGETEYRCRDIDNMAKTILDVLKGRFYKDDSQVKTLLIGKKIERRVPQNFAYVAVKELRSGNDVDALKISGLERSITLYQELKSKKIL